jgi:PAS domain S-box-containing protein
MKSKAEYESDLLVENERLKKMLAELEMQMGKRIHDENLLKNTLQELHIYQEELRTQNEELIRAQEEIEISNRKYQDLYNFAPVGFFNFDLHGKILEVNLAGAELLNQYRNRLIDKPFLLFLDKVSKNVFFKHLQHVLSGNPASDTIWITVEDRPAFPAEIVSTPFGSDSMPAIYCRSAIKDISERHEAEKILKSAHQMLEQTNQDLRKEIRERQNAENALRQSEQKIRASLREKDVLLKEIHHRVKNNMQVIRSLLNLQDANIQDERLKEYFRETRGRINAMALIHEMLYNSNLLSEIDLSAYVKGLVSGLVGMHNISPRRINVQVKAEHIYLGIDHAIPCGLVINELISNAFKHAFPDRTGEIRIDAFLISPDDIGLIVYDNGVGIPAEVDIHKPKTLGLKIIWGLVERQLGGKVEIQREKGTRFTIQFPNKIH